MAIPRVDVHLQTVIKAKRALRQMGGEDRVATRRQLEETFFTTTLDAAVDSCLDQVIAGLTAAGFRKQPKLKASECRPRRVNPVTWRRLERVADELGVSRMSLVRAVLTLLGDRYEDPRAG